jgi:hypothetical protein
MLRSNMAGARGFVAYLDEYVWHYLHSSRHRAAAFMATRGGLCGPMAASLWLLTSTKPQESIRQAATVPLASWRLVAACGGLQFVDNAKKTYAKTATNPRMCCKQFLTITLEQKMTVLPVLKKH